MSNTATLDLRELLEEVQASLRELSARVAKLEQHGTAAARQEAVEQSAHEALPVEAVDEAIPEDVVLAISAAVAAFLGERVHIRQIRLIRSGAWAQQGRVSIQASHRVH